MTAAKNFVEYKKRASRRIFYIKPEERGAGSTLFENGMKEGNAVFLRYMVEPVMQALSKAKECLKKGEAPK